MRSFFIGIDHPGLVVSSRPAIYSHTVDKIISDFFGFLTGICRDINPFVIFFINPVVYKKARLDILAYPDKPLAGSTSTRFDMFRYFINNFASIHRSPSFLFAFLFFIHGQAFYSAEGRLNSRVAPIAALVIGTLT